ncbi:hypothetical protein IFM89_006740 [Coptis chinensis]|uniref:DUF4283 domain-containing protein n=1 Tax=Coptis chinensis TaxID=261450 RepID=A0A835HUB9_9MAGN|nr:hypothetical protein IFM89_006740 [Coptis chinensis]
MKDTTMLTNQTNSNEDSGKKNGSVVLDVVSTKSAQDSKCLDEEAIKLKIEASKRKLQEGYQQAAKKQHFVKIMQLDEVPKEVFPNFTNGVVDVPLEIVEEGISFWKDYVVGFFVEKRLSYPFVKESLNKHWKVKGSYEIIADGDLFYFKFVIEEDRKMVIEHGPLFIAGRIFVVRPWSESIGQHRNKMKSLPIWVKLDLPKQLWTDFKFPSSIRVNLGDGKEADISLEYD